MHVTINNIDQTKDVDGSTAILVSYEHDGRSLSVRMAKTTDVCEHIVQFMSGNMTDTEFLCAIVGAGDADECKKTLSGAIEDGGDNLVFDGNHVHYITPDGTKVPIDETLEDHLVNLVRLGANTRDISRWSAFTRRLYSKTALRNRTYIVNWLSTQGWLSVDDEGRLLGYLECGFDENDMCPTSCTPALAIVNGKPQNGYIQMEVGNTIAEPDNATPRHADDEPDIKLHLATYMFAKAWTPREGVIARIAVAPEDIIGSPSRHSTTTIKCRKLTVLDYNVPSDDGETAFLSTLRHQG